MTDSPAKHIKAIKIKTKFQSQVIAFFILLIMFSLAGVALIVYITASQELGRSFFSAHRDLRNIWNSLLPSMIVVSICVGFLALIVLVIGLYRFKRSMENTGQELMENLENFAKGNLKVIIRPKDSGHLQPVAEAAAKTVESIQNHIDEIKDISLEMHRVVMRLNYVAFEEEEVTLKDLRVHVSNLNSLSREMTNSLKWFET